MFLEIYNTSGQLLKKTNSADESKRILSGLSDQTVRPGLYFMKIYYRDKTIITIKKFLR